MLRHAVLLLFALCVSLMVTANTTAETYQARALKAAYLSVPDKLVQIQEALEQTDLEFEFSITPNKRSLAKMRNGKTTLEMFRAPQAMYDIENFVRIEPAVQHINIWLWASTPELCKLSIEEQRLHTVTGVIGVRYFEDELYNQFSKRIMVESPKLLPKLLAANRAEFSLWKEDVFINSADNYKSYRCNEEPYVTVRYYSYLNQEQLHLKPIIEAAYQEAFGEKQQQEAQ